MYGAPEVPKIFITERCLWFLFYFSRLLIQANCIFHMFYSDILLKWREIIQEPRTPEEVLYRWTQNFRYWIISGAQHVNVIEWFSSHICIWRLPRWDLFKNAVRLLNKVACPFKGWMSELCCFSWLTSRSASSRRAVKQSGVITQRGLLQSTELCHYPIRLLHVLLWDVCSADQCEKRHAGHV